MRLSLVTLIVDDYDAAIEFFVEAIGFELVEDRADETTAGEPKRWVVVRPPGQGTGLLLARADGENQQARIGDQTGGRVGFFLQVNDFEAQHRRMVNAGVEFAEAPRYESYGTVAVWVDRWGNRWDLLGPPAVPGS